VVGTVEERTKRKEVCDEKNVEEAYREGKDS
jgi:hypothetical protein